MANLYSLRFPSKIFLLLIATFCALGACKKDKPAETGGTNTGTGTTAGTDIVTPIETNPEPGIYFAGYLANSSSAVATLWKNSISSPITNLPTFSTAKAMVLSSNNLYIAGEYRTDKDKEVAVYWKNGIMRRLTDSSAYFTTTGIAVSGSNICVSGNYQRSITDVTKPIIWINGKVYGLDLGTANSGYASGITIQNNDIYIVGNLDNNVAVYWKNGVLNRLPGLNGGFASARAITVKGDDVFVVGDTDGGYSPDTQMSNAAVYWKNGVPTLLASNGSHGINIKIQGEDVYVTGSTRNPDSAQPVATYWKNGVATVLQKNGMEFSGAFGIAIDGTDVYVVGSQSGQGAICWKNGTAIKLSNTDSSVAYDAIVVPR